MNEKSVGIIYQGDCKEILPRLQAQSVNCCVTSPPYYKQRDYGSAGQIGQERTVAEYVNTLVDVFRKVWRVLKDDGTLWLNLGDGFGKGANSKNLLGVPWRVALALQADGWCLRQDIIWSKPNCMPESVKDRFTKSHEYIFLLAKSAKYYFDSEAIKEPACEDSIARLRRGVGEKHKYTEGAPGQTKQTLARARDNDKARKVSETRNKRSVWTVPVCSYPGAHFAMFPRELIRPCIRAGCPVKGIVLDPFMGANTTGLVAQEIDRKWIGIELSNQYCKISTKRVAQEI